MRHSLQQEEDYIWCAIATCLCGQPQHGPADNQHTSMQQIGPAAHVPGLHGEDWTQSTLHQPRSAREGSQIRTDAVTDQELAPVDWDPPQYERTGTVGGKYSVERKPVFAVVEVGATQFKVSPDDLVYAEKLKGVAVNDTLALMRVLMLGTAAETIIGRPFIPDARVTAAVEVRCLNAAGLSCTGAC